MKISKSGLSLGMSQNKGTEATKPCSFSSFSFPLLAFYVTSLLPFQAFLVFFLLSSFFLSLTDLTFSILCNFLLFSVLKFCGNVAADKPLDSIDINGTLD